MDSKTSETVSYPALTGNKDPFADAFTNNPNDPTRVNPTRVGSGATTGTQTLNGTQNIINPDSDSTLTIGSIEGDDRTKLNIGFTIKDKDDFTLFVLNDQTWSWFDKTTKKNVIQIGKLPDGSYGFAVADIGKDVADGFN
jgi:hypothetical protein